MIIKIVYNLLLVAKTLYTKSYPPFSLLYKVLNRKQ